MVQHVYVARSDSGSVKIGISSYPKQRVKDLATGHPGVLKLVYVERLVNNSAPSIERMAHAILADKRISGEWFNVDDRVAISAVKKSRSIVDSVVTATVTTTAIHTHTERNIVSVDHPPMWFAVAFAIGSPISAVMAAFVPNGLISICMLTMSILMAAFPYAYYLGQAAPRISASLILFGCRHSRVESQSNTLPP